MPRYLHYAFYLASSWLWCIGAFFPLLLQRDYGTIALVAFTLFNIVGAAWFGFHFRAGSDEAFRQQQRGAINLFSYATIAYQLFFVAWLSALLNTPELLLAQLVLALTFYLNHRYITWSAVLVFAVSMLLLTLHAREGLSLPALSLNSSALHTVLPLALGFFLSPYLDITFHKAFRASDKPRLSFAFGFGGLFMLLLLFVFLYSDELTALFYGGQFNAAALYPVIAFIILQTAFTIAVHAQENRSFTNRPALPILVAVAIVGGAMLLLMQQFAGALLPGSQVLLGEALYKGFLFLYGAAFPLWLLLAGSGRRRGLYWSTLLLVAPAYFIGFIIGGELTYALSIAMLIIGAGLLITRKTP